MHLTTIWLGLLLIIENTESNHKKILKLKVTSVRFLFCLHNKHYRT